MNMDKDVRIDRSKWLEVMNVSGEMDDSLEKSADEAERLLLSIARPKCTYRIMDIKDMRLAGKSIRRHLEGCRKAVVMGATLGAGVDELIRKMQIIDMALAVIIDCGASILIEQLCDKLERDIKKNICGYATTRFSPGYGDFPIEYQKNIIRYIDGQRRIGLNVTADFIMIPRKSVTAVMGISDNPVFGSLATCGECVLREKCRLRKEGKFCGD